MKLSNIPSHELGLGVACLVYLIVGSNVPLPLAEKIDTLVGKLVIACTSIYLLIAVANKWIAGLALFVAFDLVRRSAVATGNDALLEFSPSEQKKYGQMTAYNAFPYTLEQEMVKKMVRLNTSKADLFPPSYKPTAYDTHGAKPIV